MWRRKGNFAHMGSLLAERDDQDGHQQQAGKERRDLRRKGRWSLYHRLAAEPGVEAASAAHESHAAASAASPAALEQLLASSAGEQGGGGGAAGGGGAGGGIGIGGGPRVDPQQRIVEDTVGVSHLRLLLLPILVAVGCAALYENEVTPRGLGTTTPAVARLSRLPEAWGQRWLLGVGALMMLLQGLMCSGVYARQWDFPFYHISYLPLPDSLRYYTLTAGALTAMVSSICALWTAVRPSPWSDRRHRRWALRCLAAGFVAVFANIVAQDCDLVFNLLFVVGLWLQEERPAGFPVIASLQYYIAVMHFWAGIAKANKVFLTSGLAPFLLALGFWPLPWGLGQGSLLPWLVIFVEVGSALLMFTRWHGQVSLLLMIYHMIALLALMARLYDPMVWSWNVLIILVLWRCYAGDAMEAYILARRSKRPSLHLAAPLVIAVLAFAWGCMEPAAFNLYSFTTRKVMMRVVPGEDGGGEGPVVPPFLAHLIREDGCLHHLDDWILTHDSGLVTKKAPAKISAALAAAAAPGLAGSRGAPGGNATRRGGGGGGGGAVLHVVVFGNLPFDGVARATRAFTCEDGVCADPWSCDKASPECGSAEFATTEGRRGKKACFCHRDWERRPLVDLTRALPCPAFSF